MEPNKDLVDTAVKFLLNPKVRNATDDQKRQFLVGKGLSEAEVQLALDRSTIVGGATPVAQPSQIPPAFRSDQQYPLLSYPQRTPWLLQGWRGIATIAGLIAAVIAAAYKFYQSYILPWIRERQEQRRVLNDLSNKLDVLKSSVEATMITVNKTKEDFAQLNADRSSVERVERLAQEVKSELGSVKSLLLNRKQFAPAPRIAPAIPAWQIQSPAASVDQKDEPQSSSTLTELMNTFVEEEKNVEVKPEVNGVEGDIIQRDETQVSSRDNSELADQSEETSADESISRLSSRNKLDVSLKDIVTETLVPQSPEIQYTRSGSGDASPSSVD